MCHSCGLTVVNKADMLSNRYELGLRLGRTSIIEIEASDRQAMIFRSSAQHLPLDFGGGSVSMVSIASSTLEKAQYPPHDGRLDEGGERSTGLCLGTALAR